MVQARIITIAKEDVVPAIIVIIDCRDSSWPIFDHFVFRGLPFGRRPHGVMVRDEIDSGGLCYISEALPIAGYCLAVNQFLFRHLPLTLCHLNPQTNQRVRFKGFVLSTGLRLSLSAQPEHASHHSRFRAEHLFNRIKLELAFFN